MNGLSSGNAAVPLTQSDDTPVDEQVGHLLWCADKRAAAIFSSEVGDDHMTTTHYIVMVRLFEMGQLSKNHLSQLVAMDPASTQAVVKRLCAVGMIERLPDSHDGRRIIIQLTDAGRGTVQKIRAQIVRINELVLTPLSPSEREQFLRLLKRLI